MSCIKLNLITSIEKYTSLLKAPLIQCQEFEELPVEHRLAYQLETGPNDACLPLQQT